MSLRVEYTQELEPTGLHFSLIVPRTMSQEEHDSLSTVVRGWYEEGEAEAFGPPLHSLSGMDFEQEGGLEAAYWRVDLGHAGEEAITELARRLEAFAEAASLPSARLVIGSPQPDPGA